MAIPTAPTPTPTAPTPRKEAAAALVRCLAPVDARTFLDEHRERRPLVVARNEPGRFDDLLSEQDVERLVCSTGIRYPAFRLVREGDRFVAGDYTREVSWRPPFTHTADVPRVLAAWEEGATIVLQALHVNWHPLAVFCRLLEAALGRPVQANAYFTPRGSQGFAVHHDTHDVLILQVAGEKRWLLYDPLLELPLKSQRYSTELGEPGEPTDDLILQAGDTLYLPRGWLHQAETSDTDSLHLTLGIASYSWADALRDAIEASVEEQAVRQGVETGSASDVTEILAERLHPDAVEQRRRRRFVDTRRPIREDGISQLRAVERLGPESALERRETVIADLHEGDGTVVLRFEGKEIVFPEQAGPGLRWCHESEERFTVSQLPGELDLEGRLVLVRRLVREGYLRITT